MSYVTEAFQAYLAAPLNASDVYLPLSGSATADLLVLLSKESDYTYLTISDDTHVETVKAYATGGHILLERGLANTTPSKFSYGACVSGVMPTLLAAMRSFIQDTLESTGVCQEEPDAMCTPLGLARVVLPKVELGKEYNGYIILSGVIPIDVEIEGAPSWMTVEQVHNMIDLYGTPRDGVGFTLQLKASNCGGSKVFNAVLQDGSDV